MRRYSEAVRADVRRRMSSPHRQSVARISEELGIHAITFYKWRKTWLLQGEVVPASEKEPEGWSAAADKFTVVMETAGLNSTELSVYCRERSLFPDQVERWRQAGQDANAKPVLRMAERGGTSADPAHLQPAGVRLATTGTDRASPGGSEAVYWLREQLLSGIAPDSLLPRTGQTRFGAGTSPICPPRCGVCGCTSTWWSMCGATRWWPGMSPRWRRPRSPLIWCSGPVSRSATTAPEALAAANANSHQCQQTPLILHADNGNAMRGATLESRLEEMGVLRSFSRPRVSNDNPYSESLFRTLKYRPDNPSRPFASSEPRSTRPPARQIQAAGAWAPAAGIKPKKCGSTSQ